MGIPINPINVVFDIDLTIADWLVNDLDDTKFFEEKGCVFVAQMTHYIFPGVIELMQLLRQQPDVILSLFSSCEPARNELFAEKLEAKAFGESHRSIRVLSAPDLDLSATDLDEDMKKSLKKITTSPEELENCVLVDDQTSYIVPGQEGNLLYAPKTNAVWFQQISDKGFDFTCNRICYITGVLFKAIEHVRSGGTMTQYLFPLHFSKNSDGTLISRMFTEDACHNNKEYYDYGLEKLKQINPNFTFIDRQIYLDTCKKELTPEKEEEIKSLHGQQAMIIGW